MKFQSDVIKNIGSIGRKVVEKKKKQREPRACIERVSNSGGNVRERKTEGTDENRAKVHILGKLLMLGNARRTREPGEDGVARLKIARMGSSSDRKDKTRDVPLPSTSDQMIRRSSARL